MDDPRRAGPTWRGWRCRANVEDDLAVMVCVLAPILTERMARRSVVAVVALAAIRVVSAGRPLRLHPCRRARACANFAGFVG